MEKQEYRILIKHCFLMGKTPEQSLQWLQKCYPTSAPSRTTVYRWFSEFKMGRTSKAEIVKQVHRIVLSDRKVKLRELAEAVGISKERAGYILHDNIRITSDGTARNVITEHWLQEEHDFDWDNVAILDEEPHYRKRSISEMIFIRRQTHGLNLQDMEGLLKAYLPIIDKL
ncbi:hypothetical protein ALC57_11444 [Trachymyrmex cornetzi]|uniref:Mos1 transposase HTH domain-containing protein n=1 Tax=Trachymyrmex cornetzi TaxID=471704 RepID=A0A151J2J6_9HYME|nr:hypothetical protein ALC57_11444 [Trachymyrmex cornetzi]